MKRRSESRREHASLVEKLDTTAPNVQKGKKKETNEAMEMATGKALNLREEEDGHEATSCSHQRSHR